MFDVPAYRATEDQLIKEKKCKLCGATMTWPNPAKPGRILTSSCDVEGWDTCRDCIEEHCAHTNCFGCTHYPKEGSYKDCEFFQLNKML